MDLKGTNIITHGDGDGIISAVAAIKNGANDNGIIITQPFLLAKQPDLQEQTIITDIALDNKNPQTVLEWIDRNRNKISLMIDHHIGGEPIKEILGDKYLYDSKAPSCPEFMKRLGFEISDELIDTANACDRPTDFEQTFLSKRYNEAFKVALVNLQSGDRSAVEAVQRAFIKELVSGNESNLVSERAKGYSELMKSTQKASESYEELLEGVVITKAGKQSEVDVTALLMAGYKKAEVAVVQLISSVDGSEITIVATSNRDRNLVDEFNLGSGAPFRIVLSDNGYGHEGELVRIKDILEKRNYIVKKFGVETYNWVKNKINNKNSNYICHFCDNNTCSSHIDSSCGLDVYNSTYSKEIAALLYYEWGYEVSDGDITKE